MFLPSYNFLIPYISLFLSPAAGCLLPPISYCMFFPSYNLLLASPFLLLHLISDFFLPQISYCDCSFPPAICSFKVLPSFFMFLQGCSLLFSAPAGYLPPPIWSFRVLPSSYRLIQGPSLVLSAASGSFLVLSAPSGS